MKNCTKQVDDDVCDCNTGFVEYQGKCIPLGPKCLQSNGNVNNGIPECTQCDSSISYLSNSECKIGTVKNCKQFKADEDKCIECKNTFYKSGEFCLANKPNLDQFCENFDKNKKNVCLDCKLGATKFQKVNSCQAVQKTDDNCEVYKDKHTCLKCKKGFYLNNLSKRCLTIPADAFCEEMEVVELQQQGIDINDYLEQEKYLHTCKKCKKHYFRRPTSIRVKRKGDTEHVDLTVFKCVDWLAYMAGNCEETEIDGDVNMGGVSCYGCQTDFYPYKWTDKYMCVSPDYLRERKNGFVYDSNCEQYEYDGSQIQCNACKFPYFLEAGECVDSCTAGQKVVYDVQNEKVVRNICKNVNGNASCEYYAFASKVDDNTTTGYVCVQCASTKIPLKTTDSFPNINLTPMNSLDNDFTLDTYPLLYSEVACTLNFADKAIRGIVDSDKKVLNCALYGKTKNDESAFGCQRCKQGYRGRVLKVDGDDFGYLESCEKFDECDVQMGGLDFNRVFSNLNGLLNNYLSCQKCMNGKNLVAFVKTNDNDLSTVSLQPFLLNFEKRVSTDIYQVDATTEIPHNLYQLMCIADADMKSTTGEASKLYNLDDPDNPVTNQPEFPLPENCGIFGINVGLEGNFSPGNNNIFCLACKEGYELAEYWTGNFAPGIKTCTEIQVDGNACPGNGKMLNSCNNCVKSFNTNTNVFDLVTSNMCIAAKTGANEHCIAGEMNGADLECHICDVGYEIDIVNKKCYRLDAPSCSEVNFWDQHTRIALDDNTLVRSTYLAFQRPITGCTKCTKSTDILYKVTAQDDNLATRVCLQEKLYDTTWKFVDTSANRYLQEVENDDTYVIPNCIRYGYKDNKYICLQCTAGTHFITADFQCAVKANETYMQNCKVGLTPGSSVCVECDTGFVNVGGLCRDGSDQNNTPYIDVNCELYAESTASNYKGICSKCKTDYYASNLVPPYNICKQIPTANCKDYLDNTGCITCNSGYALIDVKEQNSDAQKRICMKVDNLVDDEFDHDPNCLQLVGIGDPNSIGKQRLKCSKCKADHVLVSNVQEIEYQQQCYQVVPVVSNCAEYDAPTAVDITTQVPDVIKTKTFRCTKCIDDGQNHFLNRITNECSARNAIGNCKEYYKERNKCKECNEGFELSTDGSECKTFVDKKAFGYIDKCSMNKHCSHEYYNGLNSELNKVFSCHKCLESDQIPFSAGLLEIDQKVEGYERFKTAVQFYSDFSVTPGNDKKHMSQDMCLKPEAATFDLAGKFNFPTNCGLGFVDLTRVVDGHAHDATDSNDANGDPNKQTVKCSACKPKYKPTRVKKTLNGKEEELNFSVTACTLIANCESSEWFNACTQCKPGFSYGYDTKKGILFDVCVDVGDNKDCEAYDDVAKKCIFCKKGTILNADGFCELITPFKCQPREFRYRGQFEQKDIERGSSSDFVVGCNRCQDGYVGLLIREDQNVCLFSPYHSQDKLITNTNYIKNCDQYLPKTEGGFVCHKCASGFVPSQEGSCFADANIKNCLKASSTTLCDLCESGYVLVNRQCIAEEITNCIQYTNNKFSLNECKMCSEREQICERCSAEHYLQSNTCIKGNVKYCEYNETADVCNECQEGYILIQINEGKSYCYPIDKSLNCESFSFDFQNQELECKQCKKGFVVSDSQTDRNQTVCKKFDFVENCREYSNQQTLATSDFECVRCEDEYYLNSNSCVSRVNKPVECLEFDVSQDKCVECEKGYFLEEQGKACLPYPQGIFGCVEYKSKTQCQQCKKDFYLEKGECVEVLEKIDNCLEYYDEQECRECDTGFLQIEGKCVSIEAVDCLELDSAVACKSCPDTFIIQKTDTGITNCIIANIPNCSIVQDYEPNNCLQCSGNFYPSGKECLAVTELISNCLRYSSATECSLCAERTLLSSDKSKCLESPEIIREMDLNCTNNTQEENLVCNACRPGYYFQFGECIACDKEIMSKGCYQCDPLRPTKCLLCDQDYIQTPEGHCVRIIEESQGLIEIDYSNILTR